MGKNKKLSEEKEKLLVDEYKEGGITQVQLGKIFGVSVSTVSKTLDAYDPQLRRTHIGTKKLTKTEVAEIVTEYRQGGITQSELADKYCVLTSTINRVLHTNDAEKNGRYTFNDYRQGQRPRQGNQGNRERNNKIYREYRDTEKTLRMLGDEHGITHQAVHQIVKRFKDRNNIDGPLKKYKRKKSKTEK